MDTVDIPVIAAGGIGDARGVVAALALGAEAVQLGTAFLSSAESGASHAYRSALLTRRGHHTGLTRGFTGRLARGIANTLMTELNAPGVEFLPYPLQRSLVRNVLIPADAAGRDDLLALWAGQSASLSACTDPSSYLRALIEDVSEIAGPLMDWHARRPARNLSRATSDVARADRLVFQHPFEDTTS